MTITVNAPDGSSVTFPDGTSEGTINRVMSENFAPKAQDSLAGSAKAVASGAGEGVIGLLGLPALAADLGSRGIDYLAGTNTRQGVAPFVDKLGSENIRRAVEGVTGEFYKPQTTAEKYLHTTAEFLPALAAGPGGVARRLATQVVAPGVASEAAGQIAEGTGYEPVARVAGALGGFAGANRAVAGAAAGRNVAATPTVAELNAARTAGYQSPAVRQLEIDSGAVNRFADRVEANLQRERFSERQAGQTYDLLNSLRRPEFGVTHRMEDFDSVRKRLNSIAASPGTDGEAARRVIRSIDAFTARIPTNAVVAGDARTASRELFEARGNAAAAFRSQRIQEAIDRARNTAAATHSGGNLDNEIRKQFRTMLNNPRQMRGFNAEEREAIRAISHGGPVSNTIRRAGKLLGGGGGLGQLVSGGAGGAMFGIPGIFAVPALGLTANSAGTAMTLARARAADQLVRSRSPLYGAGNQAAFNAARTPVPLPPQQLLALQTMLAAQPAR